LKTPAQGQMVANLTSISKTEARAAKVLPL